METFNKRIINILLVMFLCLFYLFADVDPFYTKVFMEGKGYFAAGNFQEAVVNFEIAEFGLFDEQEVLKELYLYYSLAQFQLGRVDESREIIKKLKTEFNIKDLAKTTLPRSISNPIRALSATLAMPRRTDDTNYWKNIYNFELLFLDTIRQLEANELDRVEQGLRKLRNIDKKEPRLYYISGILEFKRKDYRACIKALRTFEKADSLSVEPSLLDNLYYHLSLSYLYLKNAKEAAVYYNRVKSLSIKSELYQEIKKDKEETEAKIKKQKKK